MLALSKGIDALTSYAERKGHFPPRGTSLSELGDPSLAEMADRVIYGGDTSMSLASSGKIILLKCVSTVRMKNGSLGVYCAVLSGDVILLPAQKATLGLPYSVRSVQVIIPKGASR